MLFIQRVILNDAFNHARAELYFLRILFPFMLYQIQYTHAHVSNLTNCNIRYLYTKRRAWNLGNPAHAQLFNFSSYLFWNQTWTTRMSRPVSWDSCSRTCLAGFGLVLYASLRVSSCFAVIVVRGLLLGWSPSILPPSASSESRINYTL